MRRWMPCTFVLVLSTFGLAHVAVAQPYPNKSIRVIVPFPPGGSNDIIPRLIGPKMAERMGQQVVVENRPGASGQIGLQLLKNATPDGRRISHQQQRPCEVASLLLT